MELEYTESTLRAYTRFNDTRVHYPPDPITSSIAERARTNPDAVAVRHRATATSYAELEERVRSAAGRLTRAGCGAGDIVVLSAERGRDYVAALLAILRIGAVYLPLEPSLPTPRRRQILADCGAGLLVSDEQSVLAAYVALDGPELASDSGSGHAVGILRLEELCSPGTEAQALPVRVPGEDDPAYVIYTSGSTGTPKGAMVHHAGMANHLWYKVHDLRIAPGDVVAQNAPQSFDISLWQMLAPLLTGATVEIMDDSIARDPVALAAATDAAGVTVLELVPSMLRAVLDGHRFGGPAPLGGLRALVVSGEELLPQLAADWFAVQPAIAMANAYGPTECSDDVAHCWFDGPPSPDARHMPIGTPVANTRLWLLSPVGGDRYRLCAPEEEGEIWVTGTGVGLGYLNDPERTALAFGDDPFEKGRRIYRTGDLARLGLDGLLVYLGRKDRQVKVRGNRVELSEIESLLVRHPKVGAAAVDLRRRPELPGESAGKTGGPGAPDFILVAYVRLIAPVASEELRAWLSARLPSYMVADRFLTVSDLPLTRNGKIDYRALPDPTAERPELRVPYAAPEGIEEGAINRILSEELGVTDIGRHDNFFAIGGTSLLAVGVVARINRRFGTAFDVGHLLRSPTTAGLAQEVARSAPSAAAAE